ncbi:MAG: DUF2779 domain-containing protein [Nitrospiraceae bacterium]
MGPRTLRLSKSRYIAGLQCDKRVYLETHNPELATPPDEAMQAVLDMGTEIGAIARRRYPGGRLIDASFRQTQLALDQTAAALADPSIPALFEAAFLADGVLIRVDILERVSSADGAVDGWRLIEVKSSTKKKDVHLDDLALQAHVLTQAGLQVVSCHLMYVNTRYVYDGNGHATADVVDVGQLFTLQDLTEELQPRRSLLAARLETMHGVLQRPAPPMVEPDGHCHTPHECGFWDFCTKDKPARWIYRLPGSRRHLPSWVAQGIVTIDDLPESARLTAIQARVRANREWCSPLLGDALRRVDYPVHHLDFETIMPALPRYPGTRPYEVIPIQWSNHIEQGDGELVHHEFLAESSEDPRRVLLEQLLASLGTQGSICVYSQYERAVLDSLAAVFPEHKARVAAVKKRLWDLFEVLQEHYYHPGFEGSYSIKSVLPAIVPNLSYTDLAIQGGAVAARSYLKMAFEEQDWIERQRIAADLLAYCARDTFAMVALRRALLERVSQARSAEVEDV